MRFSFNPISSLSFSQVSDDGGGGGDDDEKGASLRFRQTGVADGCELRFSNELNDEKDDDDDCHHSDICSGMGSLLLGFTLVLS